MKEPANFVALLLSLTFVNAPRDSFAQAPQQGAPAPQSATPAAAPTPAPPSPAPKSQAAAMSPALLHAQDLYRTGKFDLAAAEYNAIIAGNGPDTAAAFAGLAFGRYRQRKPLIAFDLTGASNDDGMEISGVLGFAMLYMLDIKIDYRDGLVDFTFDPNRSH